MADLMPARGMQVITSDGELIGTVEDGTPEGFMIRRLGAADGELQTVPKEWLATVDRQVRLNRTGAEAVAGWRSRAFDQEAHPHGRQAEARSRFGRAWLIWLIVAAVAALIILLLS